MNNIIIKKEPFCWASNTWYSFLGKYFTVITLAPFALSFVNNLTFLHNKKYKLKYIFLTLYIKIITTFSLGIQLAINSSRPIQDCIPSYFTKNAIPDPSIVYIWATYMIVVFSKLKKIRYYWRIANYNIMEYGKKRANGYYNPWKKLFRLILVLLWTTAKTSFYFLIYKLSYLASSIQIFVTIILTTVLIIPFYLLLYFGLSKKLQFFPKRNFP